MVIALEGVGRYLTVENGHERIFDLHAGQVLFLAPDTWNCLIPQQFYRSLALTFRPEGVRAVIFARKKVREDGTVPLKYEARWQSAQRTGSEVQALLKLLERPDEPPRGTVLHRTVAKSLVAETVRMLEQNPIGDDTNEQSLWHLLCDYVTLHWADPQLSRERIAQFCRRHPNHISRFFHAHTQCNLRTHINDIRLKHSVELLKDARYNVTEAAALCGFANLQYFIALFRRRFGITPGQYRKRTS